MVKNALETPEEAAAFRQQVVDEMIAEDAGETVSTPINTSSDQEENLESVGEEESIDPWKGVNPALKKQFDAMTSKVNTLEETEGRLKQAEKRIGAITNELTNSQNTVVEPELEKPTEEQIAEAKESDEKWKTLKDDFPDWADAIDTRLTSFEKKMTPGVSKEMLQAELKELRKSLKSETKEEIEEAVLTYAHPTWKDDVKTTEYSTWAASQNDDVKEKIKSSFAADAIEVLDLFKSSNGNKVDRIKKQRQNKLQSSVATPGRSSVAPKSEDNMTDDEFRNSAAKEIFGE